MSLLQIKDLSIKFQGNEVVKNISLNLEPGEMVGLVGESGSGKSVTALSILQLLNGAKISGSIEFNGLQTLGADYKTLQKIRGGEIGMIFQEPMTSLNPLHTIGRQVIEAIRLHQPLNKTQARKKVEELFEELGLKKFKDRLKAYPHELSGGQRQRVMIAMAIANNPKLLIADEPTTAVDVIVSAQLLKLLKKNPAENGDGGIVNQP